MHCVDGDDRMRVGGAGPHFSGDPNRFHELLFGRALFQCEPRVAADAIGALGHMRHCDRNDLLGFRWQRTVGEDALAELAEGAVDFRRKLASLLCQILRNVGIYMRFHSKCSFPLIVPRPFSNSCYRSDAAPPRISYIYRTRSIPLRNRVSASALIRATSTAAPSTLSIRSTTSPAQTTAVSQSPSRAAA